MDCKKFCLFGLLTLCLAGGSEKKSFIVESAKLPWTAVELPGVPKGLVQRVLHDNQQNKLVSAIVRFPKGFVEPRHYHTTCGHSIYILRGKLKSPEGVLSAGTFIYSAVNEPHGPFTAVEETEILFYTDGPFDYHLAGDK
jgi:quercetin dioxygenase-like cupin family protein